MALLEEVEVSRKYGERYEECRRKTPFMVPMPKWLAQAIVAPLEIARVHIKDAKGVTIALALYTAILVASSYTPLLLQL